MRSMGTVVSSLSPFLSQTTWVCSSFRPTVQLLLHEHVCTTNICCCRTQPELTTPPGDTNDLTHRGKRYLFPGLELMRCCCESRRAIRCKCSTMRNDMQYMLQCWLLCEGGA